MSHALPTRPSHGSKFVHRGVNIQGSEHVLAPCLSPGKIRAATGELRHSGMAAQLQRTQQTWNDEGVRSLSWPFSSVSTCLAMTLIVESCRSRCLSVPCAYSWMRTARLGELDGVWAEHRAAFHEGARRGPPSPGRPSLSDVCVEFDYQRPPIVGCPPIPPVDPSVVTELEMVNDPTLVPDR